MTSELPFARRQRHLEGGRGEVRGSAKRRSTGREAVAFRLENRKGPILHNKNIQKYEKRMEQEAEATIFMS